MTIEQTLRTAVAALATAVALPADAAPAARSLPTVVLVHGALIDGSGWRGVYDRLARDGYRVRIVQQPLTSLDEDVAATRRVLDQVDGPIVLVGHSYGGTVITVAGVDPKVKALVYVAGLQPDVGESSSEAAAPDPAMAKDFMASKDGFVTLDPARFAADFGADLPQTTATFMAAAQMPLAAGILATKVTAAAWHDKPSYAVIGTSDRALDPKMAQAMARRAGSKVTLVAGSHALLITKAPVVARMVEAATRATP
jgi:pimeloyl-ACP methyl ester carboxylesterase